jgi:hypothetical protein
MNTKNKIFQKSLRCLQHPATWLSISMLIINDHILKGLYPSWITGKLSDFAGLFFFPFLVAASLSFLLQKFKIPSRRVGEISFGFVGIWFVLLKTFPLVNSLTTSLTSLLLGISTTFVLDPSDLIALFAMAPAWMIWSQSSHAKPTSAAYAALLFGSLAVIATSPVEWIVSDVTNLDYHQDGIVYAADLHKRGDHEFPVAESLDGGLTWQETTEFIHLELRSLPLELCGRLNPEICYRITVWGILQLLGPELEWENVEEINFTEDENTKCHDMIIFGWNDIEYVIVAIGEHGILRRELPDGEWQVIPVLWASIPLENE